eukprot:6673352-Prymnesium_polylepis.1
MAAGWDAGAGDGDELDGLDRIWPRPSHGRPPPAVSHGGASGAPGAPGGARSGEAGGVSSESRGKPPGGALPTDA